MSRARYVTYFNIIGKLILAATSSTRYVTYFNIDKLILAATSSARYVTHFNLCKLILTATSEQRRAEDGTGTLITTMTKIRTKKKHLRLLLISPEQWPQAQLTRKTEFALRF